MSVEKHPAWPWTRTELNTYPPTYLVNSIVPYCTRTSCKKSSAPMVEGGAGVAGHSATTGFLKRSTLQSTDGTSQRYEVFVHSCSTANFPQAQTKSKVPASKSLPA